MVAGGHKTDQPTMLVYSTVVLRKSVRIAFVLAALLGLDKCMCDIGYAYLHATTEEKVYTIAGKRVWRVLWQICKNCMSTIWIEIIRCFMEKAFCWDNEQPRLQILAG